MDALYNIVMKHKFLVEVSHGNFVSNKLPGNAKTFQ